MVLVPAGFTTAWQNSGDFWIETGIAVWRHPLLVLVCAMVPAAARAYLLLETGPIPAWRVALVEALLTVWRILLCVAMVWIAVTPAKWQSTRMLFSGNEMAQAALGRMGTYLGNHLHVVLWELAFFAAAFLLLNYLLVLASRRLFRSDEGNRRKAFVSVLRNLVLVPLALIYLVELLALKVY